MNIIVLRHTLKCLLTKLFKNFIETGSLRKEQTDQPRLRKKIHVLLSVTLTPHTPEDKLTENLKYNKGQLLHQS